MLVQCLTNVFFYLNRRIVGGGGGAAASSDTRIHFSTLCGQGLPYLSAHQVRLSSSFYDLNTYVTDKNVAEAL
jgi:hypothetical protein